MFTGIITDIGTIDHAEQRGDLRPGATLVEGTAGNTGLGLALAQQVAREHRGTLTYRSRPGHTVFTLLLPIVSGAAPAEEAPRDV